MDTTVRLIRPCIELREQYLAFYEDWIHSGEEMVPWVIRKDPSDFENMLQFLVDNERGLDLPEGWVPSSTYWLATADSRVVGAVNIRHRLTEYLLNSGGHIGYGIRPSERQKGYASELLNQSLLKAKRLGIHKALVVCDAINIASEKTIRKNGGAEDTPYTEEDGNVVKRFWIEA
ncbi:GNAT family N-acetyltransferase [Paenibacillus sp. BR2-3]|uniref:GNAT family N-acetyltransferase n=1 Tax=Paenibacillus sp. BR2-3 TaxID=3048494 RepID=UPI003977860E